MDRKVFTFVELKEGKDFSRLEKIYGDINMLGHCNIIGEEPLVTPSKENVEEMYNFAKESVEHIDLVLIKEKKKKFHNQIKKMVVSSYATMILVKELFDGKRTPTKAEKWGDEMTKLIDKIKKEYPQANY